MKRRKSEEKTAFQLLRGASLKNRREEKILHGSESTNKKWESRRGDGEKQEV